MYYTLKGTSLNSENKNTPRRWIQMNNRAVSDPCNPILCTRCQYNASSVIVFDSESAAKEFAFNFDNSTDRRPGYNVRWEVIPYKSNYSYLMFYEIDTKYGTCLVRYPFRNSGIR